MKNDGCLTGLLVIICFLSTISNFIGSELIDKIKEQNAALEVKYNVVCGSLNDCCRNMIDAYNLPDSIYNNYLDVIEEQGYDKLEVKHLYFSY